MPQANPYPTTPDRNDSNLLSAWSRSRAPVLPPGLAPRRVVNPASPPPNTPTTTDRPRRLTVEPTLPQYIPTQPAAMRRAQQARQAKQQVLTPRRRVVPNILPNEDDEPRTPTRIKFKPNHPPSPPATIPPPPPSPLPAPRPKPYILHSAVSNPVLTEEAIKAAALAKSKRTTDSRCINANIYGHTSTGQSTITHTGLIDYPKTQQQADYAALLATSTPEQTWESRRKAPMVPPARAWLESDLFATQWYNAIILAYKQDAKAGELLGGTLEEQEEEKRLKKAGHLAGVSVDLEVRRYRFEADLMRRTRDMVLRDNGVMPRGALGRPARDDEPQAWSDRFAAMRMEIQAQRGGLRGPRDDGFFAEHNG